MGENYKMSENEKKNYMKNRLWVVKMLEMIKKSIEKGNEKAEEKRIWE